MRMIKQAKKKPIQIVDGSSLDDGSAGFVVSRVYRPITEKAEMLTGGVDDVAAFIVDKVTEAGGTRPMSGILVITEHLHGDAAKVSKEIVGAASVLKGDIEGPLRVIVLSDGDDGVAKAMNLEGVDEIVSVNIGSGHFDASVYEDAVIELSDALQPSLILFGHTANGMASAAAVAARLGSGYASDIIALSFDRGQLIATRSAHAGKVQQDLVFPNKAAVVLTIRGATFKAPEGAGSALITQQEVSAGKSHTQFEHVEYLAPPETDIDISKAEIILSVGRGIQSDDNIPRFAAIADKLGVTLGCSRPFADAGFLPKAHQVGNRAPLLRPASSTLRLVSQVQFSICMA